jgi:hypothetical protein
MIERLFTGEALLADLAWVLVLVIGVRALRVGLRNPARNATTDGWRTAEGRVLGGHIAFERGTGDGEYPDWHTVRVAYEYRIAGHRREGHRVSLGHDAFTSEAEARAALERYPVGAAVTVHYDPEQHNRAVLEPGPAPRDTTVPLGIAIIAGALAMAVGFFVFQYLGLP